MRFCTIEHRHALRSCLASDGLLVDLAVLKDVAPVAGITMPKLPALPGLVEFAQPEWRAPLNDCLLAVREKRDALAALAAQSGVSLFHDPQHVIWAPPIVAPRKIICVGLNYLDHAKEQNAKLPDEPLLFAKFANTLRGHKQEVELPAISQKVDLEAELAFVIAKPGRHIAEQEAAAHILGYTIANDVSARDLQARDRQWFRAKSCDGFAPMGPYLVTPEEIPDPMGLKIESRLNGTVMQSSSTRELIFNVYYLISFISKAVTLEAGDIVLTGTPSGVGVFRTPPIFLKDGDKMKISIELLGDLENPVRRSA